MEVELKKKKDGEAKILFILRELGSLLTSLSA